MGAKKVTQIKTEDQLKVYVGVKNMSLKIWVTIALLVAFFVILARIMFFAKTVEEQGILGLIDSVLAYSIRPMVTHFFPALKDTIASDK